MAKPYCSALPATLPYWWAIQSIVFALVLFSLLVQGTTLKPVLRYFEQDRLKKPSCTPPWHDCTPAMHFS
ncbi:hypothetical protein A9Q90_09480 [Gammaproteobacteria bacterium 54_18_T64]|nr:hypothetical protein A9Q90_09480 [Gammaproteobacteria bacterium 54_18_T64]